MASRREILYLEVDESEVATVTVAQPLQNGSEEYRYPRSGQVHETSNTRALQTYMLLFGVHVDAFADLSP